MDTLNHSMHGVIMARAVEISFDSDLAILFLLFAAIGAMPDLLGWLEKVWKVDENAWNWYLRAHKVDSGNVFMYLPPSALHIWLDGFCHGENKRWWVWNERLWVEVLSWIITLTLLGVLFWNHLELIKDLFIVR